MPVGDPIQGQPPACAGTRSAPDRERLTRAALDEAFAEIFGRRHTTDGGQR